MNEISGRELENRLREHYRSMPVGTARDLTTMVGDALDSSPRRRGAVFAMRRAAGLAAAAAVALVIGAVFVSMGVAPSGAASPRPAGASSARSVADSASTPNAGSSKSCGSPSPAASSGASSPDSAAACGSPSVITRTDAIAAVEKFIGRALVAPTVSESTATASGQSIQVMEGGPSGVDAWVDAQTGRVTSLLVLPVPETTNMALGANQAQTAAAAYLTAHGIPFDGLTPAVTIEDHGCCKFYVVTWQRFVNGITVPDARIVKLDPATGMVFSFTDTRVAYGPVSSPAIGREKAIELATVASGFANPIVTNVQQLVDGGPNFPGRLVWSIQLDDGAGASAFHAWVYIDAMTGEAKVVGRG